MEHSDRLSYADGDRANAALHLRQPLQDAVQVVVKSAHGCAPTSDNPDDTAPNIRIF